MTDRELLTDLDAFLREHVLRILLALDNRGILKKKLSRTLMGHLEAIRAQLDGAAAPTPSSDSGKLAVMRLERRTARGVGHGRAHSSIGQACRSIVCPRCSAGVGAGCVSTFGGSIPNYHAPRLEFARQEVRGRGPP